MARKRLVSFPIFLIFANMGDGRSAKSMISVEPCLLLVYGVVVSLVLWSEYLPSQQGPKVWIEGGSVEWSGDIPQVWPAHKFGQPTSLARPQVWPDATPELEQWNG